MMSFAAADKEAKSAKYRDPEVVLHLSQNDLAMIVGGSQDGWIAWAGARS